MSKAAELAALIGSQTALSNRNLIINGAMQVAQRGASSTGNTGAGYPTVDRYNLNLATLGTWTASQSTTAPSGFSTSYKLECTVADASPAAGDYFLFEQRIEAQNLQHLAYGTSAAKAMTLSFWVRSNKTGTYITEIQHGDAGSNYWNNSSYTISAADTWEFKSIPVTGQTASAINNDNGTGFFVRWFIGAGTNSTSGTLTANTWHDTAANRAPGQVNLADTVGNEWYITGIQLEVGEQATPFEHRSMADELARCQRYFFNPMAGGNGQSAQIGFHSMLNMGGAVSTGNNGHLAFHVPFPVSMRAAPSLTHDLSNTKINVGAPSGTQVAFYIQNQGYRDKAGNGNLNTLSRATGTSAGCVVGTYYISPAALIADQINIGAANKFHFSAEL